MKNFKQESSGFRHAYRHINRQARELIDAGASEDVIDAYALMAEFLRTHSDERLREIFTGKPRERKSQIGPNLEGLSLDYVDSLLADESLPRRELERVAIGRFNVPKGSMRSYKTIEHLRAKIRTEVENARTHEAIGNIARKSVR